MTDLNDNQQPLDDRELPDAADLHDGGDSLDNLSEPCPHCGKPVFDDAEVCPRCGAFIEERAAGQKKSFLAVGVTTVLVFILVYALVYFF